MEIKKARNIIIILILLFLTLFFKIFSVKTAENVVYQYYSCIQKEDWEEAYKYLSKNTKKSIPFNKFEELYKLKNEFEEIESFGILKGCKDDKIVIVPVTIKIKYLYDGDEILENSFKSRLVLEGMNYRLILKPSEFYTQLSQSYVDYIWEKFIWRDDIGVNEVAEAINKAIEYDQDNPDIYYTYANIATNEDDVLYLLDKSIELAKKRDYWHLSYVYNMKGTIFEEQGNLEDARTNYLLAVKEDEKNENAVENLKNIDILLNPNSNNEKKETDKKIEITESDKIYINKSLTIINDYAIGLEKVVELLQNSNLNSENWLSELAISILFIQTNCDVVDELLAPDKFSTLHKELMETSRYLRLAMDDLIYMIDNPNLFSLESYEKNMETASKYMKKVINEANDVKTKYEF